MVHLLIQLGLTAVSVGCVVTVLAYDESLLTVTLPRASFGCNLIDCTSNNADTLFTSCDGRADGRKAALGMTCIILIWELLILLLRAACTKRHSIASAAGHAHFLTALIALVLIGLTVSLVKADFPEENKLGLNFCKAFGQVSTSGIRVTTFDADVGPAPYLFAGVFVAAIVSGVLSRRSKSGGSCDI